jgi:hypothetical protein
VQRPAPAAHGSVVITDFGISVRHFERLLGGLVLAMSPRVEWAKLLRRTYAVDVLACTHCGGRLRLLSAITEKATAEKILQHLGLAAELPAVRPRSRDPTETYAELPPVS